MIHLGREVRVKVLLTAGRIDKKEASGFEHDRRADETVDQLQSKIDPGHHTSCCHDIPVIDDEFVLVNADIGKVCSQQFSIGPMGGCRPAIQQSYCGQPKCPSTHRADERANRMLCLYSLREIYD
jgi:hypothetical protein